MIISQNHNQFHDRQFDPHNLPQKAMNHPNCNSYHQLNHLSSCAQADFTRTHHDPEPRNEPWNRDVAPTSWRRGVAQDMQMAMRRSSTPTGWSSFMRRLGQAVAVGGSLMSRAIHRFLSLEPLVLASNSKLSTSGFLRIVTEPSVLNQWLFLPMWIL